MGAQGIPGGLLGPMGPNVANFPIFGKTFFRESTRKSKMSTLGAKTKVVRAEILHILVPIPSRGDLYLTISRTFNFLPKLGFLVQFLMYVFFLGFSGAAQSFFRGKNRPFPKLNRGTLDFYHFLTFFDDFL